MTLWCERMLQGGRNSGRAVARMSSGACAPRSASARMRSSEVGSAHCRSSKASTTGCERAPARTQATERASCRRRNSSGAKERLAVLRQGDVDQRREQRRMFGGVEADQPQACSRGRRGAARRAHPRQIAAGPIRRSDAAACSARAARRSIRPRCAASRASRARNSSISRDLPMPGLADDQHELAFARPRALPAAREQRPAPPRGRRTGSAPARRPVAPPPLARTMRKSWTGSDDALELARALLLGDEEPGDLALDVRGDEHRTRLGDAPARARRHWARRRTLRPSRRRRPAPTRGRCARRAPARPCAAFLALISASARWMASAARTARSASFSCACG